MGGLSELELLMPPPPEPRPERIDWPRVESDLELQLPSDYKSFIERYGMGKIDDFITVFHPTTAIRQLNLKNEIDDQLSALHEVRDGGEQVPYPIFPEPGGVLPWAVTDNADVCYWLTYGLDPDTWMVVVNEGRGPTWEEYRGSATEFLADVISSRQQISIFPEDFPSRRPRFSLLPEAWPS